MRSAKSTAHDAIVRGFALLTARRRVRAAAVPLKINLGSGLIVAPGWVNVDVGLPFLAAPWPRPLQRWLFRLLPPSSAARRDLTEDQFVDVLRSNTFIHHRVEHGLPFEDAAADYIYTSHLLEHLYLSHARKLLRECWRVLRPGGVLRVCVPDLSHAVHLFSTGEIEQALQYFFCDVGPSAFTRHRYMYDYATLTKELLEAGFGGVARSRCGEGRLPDLAKLDNRPGETLYVEAEKAARVAS